MKEKFSPNSFEDKWRDDWEEKKIYQTEKGSDKQPCYVLDMFPYPSGSSMHVGHPRGFVATDVYSRFKRMNNFNVLHPMGWDAFGLPAEETAIKNKEHPSITVKNNIEKFKKQLMMLGLGYDWSREINTTEALYYKQTQRIFLEFFRRGLAKNEMVTVNWCPELGTALANEDIEDGKSERGGHTVMQKPMRQWVLKITEYADRLLEDLDKLPKWPEKIKKAQRNWIGESIGHTITFDSVNGPDLAIFTSRIETLPGATFLVVAPDSEYAKDLMSSSDNEDEIKDYIVECSKKTDLEKQSGKKTGVVVNNIKYKNPLTGETIPVLVSDYVLAGYGTGAIMAVPNHDSKDKEIAELFGFEGKMVIDGGELVNAGEYNGLSLDNARERISSELGIDEEKKYKIRDWIFSRQRFWGEPFPIVWVKGRDAYEKVKAGNIKEWMPKESISYEEDGQKFFAIPVAPEFLDAMKLPDVDYYENTKNMEGPLAGIDEWTNTYINVNTGEISNKADGSDGWIPAKRETNTMPQWAGSSWYWLRYMDPDNADEPFSKNASKYWGNVNIYAGADHAVAHLIYARFWHKVMYDAGFVDYEEPFERLEFLGHVLAADGSKISKRKGNSRSPEEIISQVGADAFRLYEMMLGPFEKAVPWNDNGLLGARRFLEKVWNWSHEVMKTNSDVSDLSAISDLNKLVHSIESDIERFRFNIAASNLMIFLNNNKEKKISISDMLIFVKTLSPFCPYITEEIWSRSGETSSVHKTNWPIYNERLVLKDEYITIPIQINGKRRSEVSVKPDIADEELQRLVEKDENIKGLIEGKVIKRFIRVGNKIVNLVI